MKRCSHCYRILPKENFYRDMRVKDRLFAHCKSCHSKMQGNVSLVEQVRVCSICGNKFTPIYGFQKVCGFKCRKERERQESKRTREKHKSRYVKHFWEQSSWKTQTPTIIYHAKTGYNIAVFRYVSIGEHRLIMMKHLGRKLERWEQVHHKNRIKTDNQIENLELTPHGHNYIIVGIVEAENKRLKEENQKLREELEFMKTIQHLEGVRT